MGRDVADPRGGELHQGPHHRARQAGHARQGQARRFHEDSAWREILEYFSSATQVGLTATPKETRYVSNIAYFGDPVYSYSLKQGIHDGFLASYTVIADLEFPLPRCGGPRKKVYVDGVEAAIVAERVEYLGENGKLVTESLRDFTRRTLRKRFASLDDFLKRWTTAEHRQAILDDMEAEGLPLTAIAEELGKDLDPFDLVCHIAFDAKPLTHRERAENVKKRDVFTKYGDQARAVLGAPLDKYADDGVLRIPPLDKLRTPLELVGHDLQSALYRDAA